MSARKQRLELTWIGKDERPRLEPRILLEDTDKSYHAKARVTDHDIFDNILIQGDNLLALKALETEYTGKVKCVYIDPPYNTGSAFEHYNDGVEHSLWLQLMRDRLELLRRLLSADGSAWITLDDNEAHYCKVLCDEVFGRPNFLADVIWEKSDSPRMDAEFFSSRHDHILVYAKDAGAFVINKGVTSGDGLPEHYNKTDDAGRPYYLKPLRAMGGDDRRADRPTLFFPMTAPDGTLILPKRNDGSDGRWRWGEERTRDDAHLIEWISGRAGWTPYYRIYGDLESKRPPETIWTHADVGSNRTSKAESNALFGRDAFQTPKPERLLERVMALATKPGDIVLDSFAGSGTTGAVAQKMGRRWIMVELGNHCETHIAPRLRKTIDGTDAGGITEAVEWKGGGGFRYYCLAPSLLEKDAWGNWVISKEFDAAKLSQAVCKLMGFIYRPDEAHYWMQGCSSETDFIYVTTQSLTHDQLAAISEEVGDTRTLLVCCKAFRANADAFPNLTVRKIPQAVLRKCEWGHDDYSLNVANLPEVPRAKKAGDYSAQSAKSHKKRINGNGTPQDDLFGQEEGK
jgi:adenine-specific DNA-methyltransferase